ncbi:MAG: DsbA family protein [Alcanivorax sp.]
MKRINKILIVLLVVAVSYLLYAHTKNVNEQIARAYDVPAKYTQTSPGADIVVMDFNNYKCEICRQFHPVLKEALARDGRVRYISRSVTWGDGDWGKTLITAAYAAGEQGKFIEMHDAIYENWPVNDMTGLYRAAESAGIDTKQLSRDMNTADVNQHAEENIQFFQDWGINRTPTLLIGKRNFFKPTPDTTVDDVLREFEKVR